MNPQTPVSKTRIRVRIAIVVAIWLVVQTGWFRFLDRSAPGGWRSAFVRAVVQGVLYALAWFVGRTVLAWLDRDVPDDGKLWLPPIIGFPVAGAAMGLLTAATDPHHRWLTDTATCTAVGAVAAGIALWSWRDTRARAGSIIRIRRRS
jgi:hypothetical protein